MRIRIKNWICTAAAALLPWLAPQEALAQGGAIVFDPTSMAQGAADAASNIEEIINLGEQLFEVGETSRIIAGIEDLQKVIGRFQEAGVLLELVDDYAGFLESAVKYSKNIREWAVEEDNFEGYVREMRYIVECKTRGVRLYEEFVNYFKEFRTNDESKYDKLSRTRDSLRRVQSDMLKAYVAADARRRMKRDISLTLGALEEFNSAASYSQAHSYGGSFTREQAKGWLSLVYLLNALTLVGMAFVSYVMFFRGDSPGASGATVSATVMTRLFIALVVSNIMLNILQAWVGAGGL